MASRAQRATASEDSSLGWPEILGVLAGLAAVMLAMEWRYPYYFLQDDNRDYMLPWMVHNWRTLMNGELALYNFHQYSGFPSLGSASGALYPPSCVAVLFSGALFGHHFAAVDIMVGFTWSAGR